jgi:hypothetical protein
MSLSESDFGCLAFPSLAMSTGTTGKRSNSTPAYMKPRKCISAPAPRKTNSAVCDAPTVPPPHLGAPLEDGSDGTGTGPYGEERQRFDLCHELCHDAVIRRWHFRPPVPNTSETIHPDIYHSSRRLGKTTTAPSDVE